jgi:hypothetical protein
MGTAEHASAAISATGWREALARADADVSLVHDFLYGRGGRTMDDAHAASWRIHDILRTHIHSPEPAMDCHCTGLQEAHNRGCPFYVRPNRRRP